MFFLLFFLIPLVEIYFLIQVGSMIGAGPTIFLVLITAVIGAILLRWQGMSTFFKFQSSLAQGQLPAEEIMESFALIIGGAFLLTPGFFTDTFGFLLLFPVTRLQIIKWILLRFSGRANWHIYSKNKHSSRDKNYIEGEFREDKDD